MKSKPKRTALTLLEVMIVLAISASLIAIAWPSIRRLTERTALKQAALDVKAALADTRDRAIRSGESMSFHYVMEAPDYWILAAETFPVDQLDANAPSNELRLTPIPASDPTVSGQPPSGERPDDASELPDDILFLGSLDSAKVDSIAEAAGELSEIRIQTITFFADGKGTPATIRLYSPERSQSISIDVRRLTGTTTLGPIERERQMDSDRQPSPLTNGVPELP